MDFIVENLAIGNYQEALAAAADINALLCVAAEHDIYQTKYKYYKVPNLFGKESTNNPIRIF